MSVNEKQIYIKKIIGDEMSESTHNLSSAYM